jgi:hypothetical protein
MHIVSKVWNFLKTRRKLSLAAFVIILAVVGIGAFIIFSHVGVSDAHAQAATTAAAKPAASNPATATTGRGLTDKIVEYIATILLFVAQFFIQITIFILRFIIEVGAYNGYIDSNAVNYGWIMVRDVTNMFFVIILLVIAFGTILGLEQYEYKKLLFKMIAAAVIVNFSRTICGLIIDVAQVIMVTFINGVAATAGGNLINMFNLPNVLKMAQTSGANITPKNVFLASLAALIFSAMAMATMFVFLIMLLARLITLWILIVLSPLAFVLNVIPQTQKYASQWWTEFGNNVVSGPIIAFFLWLAFVTAGSGNANADIVSGLPNQNLSVSGGTTESVGSANAGISEAMDWTKMASFAIAIGMLLVGAKMAQQLGVAGGAMMGKAVDFGKRVATVASGISAARWAGRRGLAAGKAAGKFAAMKAPILGGEAWQRRGRTIKAAAGVVAGKVGMGRDYIAKQMEKAAAEEKEAVKGKGLMRRLTVGALGLGAKAVAGKIETSARAERRVKNWESWAKNTKELQEEKFGLGGSYAARKSGASSKELEDMKKLNDRDKRRGLNIAESNRLDKVGRHDEAEALRMSTTAEEMAEMNKKFENMDQAGLKATALDLVDEMGAQKNAFMAAEAANNDPLAREIAGKLAELEMKRRSLVSTAGNKDYETYRAVGDVMLDASGFSGERSVENAPLMMQSMLSGFNHADKNTDPQQNEKVLADKLTQRLTEAQKTAMSESNRQLGKLGYKLSRESGDLRPAVAFSQGIKVENGRRKVVTDFGANVGKFDTAGKERTEAHDTSKVDAGALGYYKTQGLPSFSSTVNSEVVINVTKDADGNVMSGKVDEHQAEVLGKYLSKFTDQTITRQLQPALVKQINAMAGKLSPEEARKMMQKLREQITDDKAYKKVEQLFADINKQALGTTPIPKTYE